jgi:hypothetical protein
MTLRCDIIDIEVIYMIIQEEIKIKRFIDYDGKRFYQGKQGYWVSGKRYNSPVRLHTYVWEKHNGKTPKGYHVHHIDGNKENNDIENLRLMKPIEHFAMHDSPERKEKARDNLNKNGRPKAAEWHKSFNARAWAKENYKTSLGKLVGVKARKNCEICGKEFDYPVARPLSKYCSGKCKDTSRRLRGADNIEKICVICGNKFMGNKFNNRKTCSIECKTISTNITKVERYGKSKKNISNRY